MRSYPVWPELYGVVQSVPRALSGPLWLGLPVTKHVVVLHYLASLQAAAQQATEGLPGGQAGVVGGEVTQETEAIADCVKTCSVSSLDIPAAALVDQSVSSHQETERISFETSY